MAVFPKRCTVEGSLAMLRSLIIISALTTTMITAIPEDPPRINWRPVCVVAALLEAFTLQIDNLVLPLVGVALLLFL